MTFGAVTNCQVCEHTPLLPVLFLGYLPPVNLMRPLGKPPVEENWYPAEMLYCSECHLVQLGYVVDPRILFPPEYPYTSGTTRILRENFAELYRDSTSLLSLNRDDLIVDIGSNDGTLLSNFQSAGHRVAGIEPSLTAKIAEGRGIPTLMRYFDSDAVQSIKQSHGSPRVVTATNVFAHIPRVGELMRNIADLTGEEGVFISESHYLGSLIETLQYDTIYHEHLRYYSLISIRSLLERFGFRVLHVKKIPTHGGSIRVYATRSARYATMDSVQKLVDEERKIALDSPDWIQDFRRRTLRSKLDLYELLSRLKRHGATIYGIGAPSRASTLINYVGIDDGLLECILEVKGSLKVGKYVPGRNIPVLEEAKLYADQPPFVLLLSWHIAGELCGNLKRNGYRGDFILPLPHPHLIRHNDVV